MATHSQYGWKIDSFSGKVASLTARQKRDPEAVLRCLRQDPFVSTWDMGTHNLWHTIKGLEQRGLIVAEEAAYPWNKYRVVAAHPDIGNQ